MLLPNLEAYPKTVLLRDGTEVQLRPLEKEERIRLLQFFERIPEAERYYLKENVTSPEVIKTWTANALTGDKIVADATLHRSRTPARRHIGELRLVVDPKYREIGLGSRLIRELLEISLELQLHKLTLELVAQKEKPAIMAAASCGFREVATLKEGIRDPLGNYQDLVLSELPLKDQQVWVSF